MIFSAHNSNILRERSSDDIAPCDEEIAIIATIKMDAIIGAAGIEIDSDSTICFCDQNMLYSQFMLIRIDRPCVIELRVQLDGVDKQAPKSIATAIRKTINIQFL